MTAVLLALVVFPSAAGAVLGCVGRRADRFASLAAITVALATVGMAMAVAITRPAASAPLFVGMRAGLGVDGLSAVLVLTVTAIFLAVLVFAAGDLRTGERRARFFGEMLLFVGAMLLTVTATTLPVLLTGWEIMGATSWALIGFWWREPVRVQAATTAFLTTRAGDLGLYLAAGAAVAGGVGGLQLADLAGTRGGWRPLVAAGVIAAALGKSAQLPFSFWLSRAMQGPSAVSALLHSATMVAAGAYLLLRLHPLLVAVGGAADVVMWAGALTALILGLVAVAQRDFKQLLAASTCAQIGFMVLAAGSGATAGGTAQLVAHAATKALLFCAAGAWLTALGTKRLAGLRGAAREYRLVGVVATVGLFVLAGLPPGSLWATKDEVLAGALGRSPALYVVGLTAAFVSTAYSARAAWYLWQPQLPDPGHDDEQAGTRRVPRLTAAPLPVLAAAAVVLGVLTVPGVDRPLRAALHASGAPHPHPWELVVSAAGAVFLAGLVWGWGDRRAPRPALAVAPVGGWLRGWLDLERIAHATIVRPTLRLAVTLAAFDDRRVDGAVRASVRATRAAAAVSRRVDGRDIDGLVHGLVAVTRRLGVAARRPQTGLLHQYYAQAALAFGALALLAILVR